MSEDLRYPVVMPRLLYCAHCQRYTDHASVIYPDTEYNTCKVCDHKQTIHYNRSVAVVYKDVDQVALEGISDDLNRLMGELATHKFGHIGKKDLNFLEKVTIKINAIKKRVDKLKGQKDE